MENIFYARGRDSLLEMRETLLALPDDAQEAENWVRVFSKGLVRIIVQSHPTCMLKLP
jgi:hypothetical protein